MKASRSYKADGYVGSVTLDKDFRADAALTPSGSVIDKSTIAGKMLTPPGFIGHSLTLAGDIGINFFTLLTDDEIGSGAVVDFNLIATGSGAIAEIQGTGEGRPYTQDELSSLVSAALPAVGKVIEAQKEITKAYGFRL